MGKVPASRIEIAASWIPGSKEPLQPHQQLPTVANSCQQLLTVEPQARDGASGAEETLCSRQFVDS